MITHCGNPECCPTQATCERAVEELDPYTSWVNFYHPEQVCTFYLPKEEPA